MEVGIPIYKDALRELQKKKPKTQSYEEIQSELREKLRKAMEKTLANVNKNKLGLLLSGIDSLALACLYPTIYSDSTLKTITVGCENSLDLNYANRIVSCLGIENGHYEYVISKKDVEKFIPKIHGIRILHTNDFNLPNDLIFYFGLKLVEKYDIRSVMTGEGADELFSGNICTHFASNDLGKYFRINIIQPYLESEFMEFVKKNNIKKSDLRITFADYLSDHLSDLFGVIYARRFPLGQSSGLTDLINSKKQMVSKRM